MCLFLETMTVTALHILRTHTLGLAAARDIAAQWATQAEHDFGMTCRYTPGELADTLHFARSGVRGVLLVDAHRFELTAELGFLLSGFKSRIEAEITANLDALLSAPARA